jgi:hypothetical protein
MTSIYSGNGFYNEGYQERCFPKTSWEWTERIVTDIYNSPDFKQLVINKYNLDDFMKYIEKILPDEIIHIIFNFICKEIKIKSESYKNEIEIINNNDNELLNSIHTEIGYDYAVFIKPLTQNDPFIYLYDDNNNYIYQYHINTHINNIYSNKYMSNTKTLRFYNKIHKRISSFQYAFENFKLYSFSDDLLNFSILTYYKTIATYKLYVFNTKSNKKRAHTLIINNDSNQYILNIKWENNNIIVSHYKNGLYIIQKYNSNTLELID